MLCAVLISYIKQTMNTVFKYLMIYIDIKFTHFYFLYIFCTTVEYSEIRFIHFVAGDNCIILL